MSGILPTTSTTRAAIDRACVVEVAAMEADYLTEAEKAHRIREGWDRAYADVISAYKSTKYFCGICESRDQDPSIDTKLPENGCNYYPTDKGSSAHGNCLKLIEPARRSLDKTVDVWFRGRKNAEIIDAQKKANEAVRKACGSETLLTYLKKNGEVGLAYLFNTAGIGAVENCKAELEKKEMEAASLNTVDVKDAEVEVSPKT